MATTTHPSFHQPISPETPVWRYMSLAKFIAFLNDQALYFSRSDLLGDPYEGTITVQNAANIQTQFCDPSRPDLIIKVRKMWKLFTYVNCWHMNDGESEAMWRLYCPSNDGIALKSTYSKLAKSIGDKNVHIGLVSYIDYHTQYMPLDNAFNPFMHKRKAFEHEREVRAVFNLESDIQSVERDFDEIDCLEKNPKGIKVPVDMNHAINEVFVNPYAPSWYYEVVQTLFDAFNVSWPLRWSQIADNPSL